MGTYLATGILYDMSIQKRKKNDKILNIFKFLLIIKFNIFKIL